MVHFSIVVLVIVNRETMKFFELVLLTSTQLLLSSLGICCQETVEWSHTLFLEKGVEVRWNSNDPEWLTMEMSAPVTGYVAVGFSPNGAMKGSDIVLGWVDSDDKPQILDLYAVGNKSPIIDESQDYELISGKESDGFTTIRFRRKWNTCDALDDMVLGADSSRLIWAISQEDPVDNNPKYHGEHRGVRRTFIRNKVQHTRFPDDTNDDPSIKQWDVKMSQNIIDAEDDIYFCKIAKFPKMDTKQHLIGYRPLLQKGNEFSIHHIILYECKVPGFDGLTELTFEKYTEQKGGRCYTPNMPLEWGTYCTTIPILWTAGSEGNMFPSHVGSPLGEEHGGTTYFMFEIHYDNPQLKAFVDSSGFRLFYTDKLREYESSSVLVGTKIAPFHVVPPKMTSFTTLGYCTSECTAQAIPPEGMTVTTVLLHAHRAARKIILRHIRNGQELPPIAQENHYDFDYQQARVIEPNRKIMPGDELITECEYETTDKIKPAFGGLGTRDEMCMSFVYYYPKIDFTECKTQHEFYSFLNALGINKVEGDILKEINMPYEPNEDQTVDYPDSPLYLANSTYNVPLNALDAMVISDAGALYSTVADVIYDGVDWKKDGKTVESKWLAGKQYAFCTGNTKKRIPLKNYIVNFPQYEKYTEPPDSQCAAKDPNPPKTPDKEVTPPSPPPPSQPQPAPSPPQTQPATPPPQTQPATPPPQTQPPYLPPQPNPTSPPKTQPSYSQQTKTIAIYSIPSSYIAKSNVNRVYGNQRPPQVSYYVPITSNRHQNFRKTSYSPPNRRRVPYSAPQQYRYQPQYQIQRSQLLAQQHYTTRGFTQPRW